MEANSKHPRRTVPFPSIAALVAVLGATAAVAPTARAQATPDTLRLTLMAAMQRVLETSPDVRAQESVERFAEARHDLARASRFVTEFSAQSAHAVAPGLENPNGTPVDRLWSDPDVRNDWDDLSPFNRLEISAVQPIWTAGELSGNIAAARSAVEVERQGVRARRIEAAVRTAELWYGLSLAKALDRLTGEAGDIVDRALREIDDLLAEGAEDVDEADRFQVLITRQEFLRRVVEVRERLETVRTGLRRQLLLPDDQVPDVTGLTLDPLTLALDSLDFYLEAATANRPEPLQADAGVSARSALVRVARSASYPKLFLGVEARYSWAEGRFRQFNPYLGDPFLSRSVRAGFGLRMDLNVLQTRARVEQARAQLAEVSFQAEAARAVVLYEAEAAWRAVRVKRAALDAAEEALKLSKDWLRSEEISFDLDYGSTENLVDAVRVNLEQQAARHQAVFDYNMAVVRLLAATGMLDRAADFGMQLD